MMPTICPTTSWSASFHATPTNPSPNLCLGRAILLFLLWMIVPFSSAMAQMPRCNLDDPFNNHFYIQLADMVEAQLSNKDPRLSDSLLTGLSTRYSSDETLSDSVLAALEHRESLPLVSRLLNVTASLVQVTVKDSDSLSYDEIDKILEDDTAKKIASELIASLLDNERMDVISMMVNSFNENWQAPWRNVDDNVRRVIAISLYFRGEIKQFIKFMQRRENMGLTPSLQNFIYTAGLRDRGATDRLLDQMDTMQSDKSDEYYIRRLFTHPGDRDHTCLKLSHDSWHGLLCGRFDDTIRNNEKNITLDELCYEVPGRGNSLLARSYRASEVRKRGQPQEAHRHLSDMSIGMSQLIHLSTFNRKTNIAIILDDDIAIYMKTLHGLEPETHLVAGILAQALGRRDEAVAHWKHVREANPPLPDPWPQEVEKWIATAPTGHYWVLSSEQTP